MKHLIFILILLQCKFVMAAMPVGFWHADPLTADDGSYGAYYKGWLVISETEVDQIITLGAHYDKKKYLVTGSDNKSADIYDPEDQSSQKLFYQVGTGILTACFGSGGCKDYRKVLQGPVVEPPPKFYPRIQIISKWCVEQDCETLIYSEHQSESLFNLYPGFKPAVFKKYVGPNSLAQRHGVELGLTTFSYRFENDGSKLSSFATSMFFTAENKIQSDTLKKSGVLRLKEGVLATLEGAFDHKKVSVEFSIKTL